jgi:hypothetical protein
MRYLQTEVSQVLEFQLPGMGAVLAGSDGQDTRTMVSVMASIKIFFMGRTSGKLETDLKVSAQLDQRSLSCRRCERLFSRWPGKSCV